MSRRESQYFMRPMASGDLDAVAGWLQDLDDLSLFDRGTAMPPNRDALRELWKLDLSAAKAPAAYWFAVEDCNRKPVAIGGLQSISYANGDAVLPILVSGPVRGRGIGLRIAVHLLDMAFDRLRLRRVTTYYRSDNQRTERLTKRAGFRHEGRMREAWFAGGKFHDCIVVGVLREEWQARRESLQSELDGSISILLHAAGADGAPFMMPSEISTEAGKG
jgi:RimJ/RimL family protein N-acetyltransferase